MMFHCHGEPMLSRPTFSAEVEHRAAVVRRENMIHVNHCGTENAEEIRRHNDFPILCGSRDTAEGILVAQCVICQVP